MLSIILLSLITAGNPLEISLWVDKEDAIYRPGDNLTVYFSANRDCYFVVYNVEQGGGVTQLFPPEDDNGWIRGGQTYQLPPEYADYDYAVKGPEGVETVIAVACIDHLPALEEEGPDIATELIDIQIKEPESAELIIVTVPKNCRIYITEVESGETEYVGDSPRGVVVRPGEYIVEIKKAGYRTLERNVSLRPGEKRKVHVRL